MDKIKRTLDAARIAVAVLAVVSGTALGAQIKVRCAKPSMVNWPMLQHDPAHSGRSQVNSDANPGHEKWEFVNDEDGANAFSAPVVGADGVIYVASDYLYALNPDGKLKWKLNVEAFNAAPAVGADGTIYVGGEDDDLTCMFAVSPNGARKWKFKTANVNPEVTSAPVVGDDGTIYFGSRVYAYKRNPRTGIYDVLAKLTGSLYALAPDGKLKWRFPVDGSIDSAPAVHDGTVYFGSRDHNLYALSPAGKLKWKFATGGQVHGAPSIAANGVIYVGSDDRHIYAMNPDGVLRWKFRTGDSVDSGPAIGADGTIYVGAWDGILYAMNPDGKSKWKFATGNDVFASPAIGADGVVYIGGSSANGKLYAVSSTGVLKWAFATDGPMLESPAIGPDGTVYATSYFSAVQYGLCATVYAIGTVGHAVPSTGALPAVQLGDESLKMDSLTTPANWKLYHNPASGLSFRYPPFVRVSEPSERQLDARRSALSSQQNLSAKVDLGYRGRWAEDGLLSFELYDHLTSDQIAAERRDLGGCGYAHHLKIAGRQALACADCTAVCWWTIYLFAPGEELQIAPMPLVNGDDAVWPIDGMEKRFLELMIIRSVRWDPPKDRRAPATRTAPKRAARLAIGIELASSCRRSYDASESARRDRPRDRRAQRLSQTRRRCILAMNQICHR